MAENSSEPTQHPKPVGLWARLRNALAGSPRPESAEEVLPTFDVPVEDAKPVEEWPPASSAVENAAAEPAMDHFPLAEAEPISETPEAAETPASVAETPAEYCPACGAARAGTSQYCFDCGYMYRGDRTYSPAADVTPKPAVASGDAALPEQRVANRYRIVEALGERLGVRRYRAVDEAADSALSASVILVQAPSQMPESSNGGASPFELDHELPPAEFPAPQSAAAAGDEWPGPRWEWRLFHKMEHDAWPRAIECFTEDGYAYLVEEEKTGRPFWDAWEDPGVNHAQRFEWLAEIADALKALHDAGAIVESIRPEMLVITGANRPAFREVGDLLPLPLPPQPPIRGGLYTAPELVLAPENADARADLYGFGAMLYSLYLGRELTETDFERPGTPKPFALQFPDVHPALARIVMKTFTRDRDRRFPSDEASSKDPTGFTELAGVLRTTGRLMMQVRLDVAGWTTTGMVRTNNEDAFALMQAVGSRQDDLGEQLLAILADGMGGYEAGEVAAALAIDNLRRLLLSQPQLAGLVGQNAALETELDPAAMRQTLVEALRETNRIVFQAARTPGAGKRGMGCTAEVVIVLGRKMFVGHVGDSRTYHYSTGRLVQVSKDQTLVNRLVELGQLTQEEAENHPRKNELQQAIGGQPTVDPLTYEVELSPGDWVLLCSDGLTGHVNHETLTEMVQRADSAEMLARRLCNLANLYGGTDNCTVIAIRVS